MRSPSTVLTVSVTGSPGTTPSQPSARGREHPFDHGVGDERSRGVVHEHDEHVVGDLGEGRANRLGSRRAARDGGDDLAGGELLGEQDRRLLPALGSGDDDRVDPARLVQAAERLGEHGQLTETDERLGPLLTEPLSRPRGDEEGPDAHSAKLGGSGGMSLAAEAVMLVPRQGRRERR